MQNPQTREIMSTRKTSTVILTWHASKYKVYKGIEDPHTSDDIPLAGFMYVAFIRMPGESYRVRLRSFLFE